MKIIIRTNILPRAIVASTAPPLSPPLSPANTTPCVHEESETVGMVSPSSASATLLGCGSRKRPPPLSSDPTHVHLPSSPYKRPPSALAGPQDLAASLKSSIHQSEASTKAIGCQTSLVARSQFGQAKTSAALQPESGLTSEVKTETADVATATEGQGTYMSLLIKEEPYISNGAKFDHKTDRNIGNRSDRPHCSIDANFLEQVVLSFDKARANQEERATLAKESISMNPSLESTFLAILKKHGDITKDCPLESGYMLRSVLEVICKVVQELQKKHLTEVDCNLLDSYYSVVSDAEKFKLNVKWLRTRLDEIKEAVKSIVEMKKLNDEVNERATQIKNEKKDLEIRKAELEKLKSEVEEKESRLVLDELVAEELSMMINDRALRIQHLQNMTLMEAFL